MTAVKEEELVACRICLAVDVDLYDIHECKLEKSFTNLMGIEVSKWDGCPQHVCVWCRTLMLKYSSLRRQCQRSQGILQKALVEGHIVTMDYLRTIDRVAQKLTLNLKTCAIYISDSTHTEIVKIEETIKEEANDIVENVFVNEPEFDSDANIENQFNEETVDDLKSEAVETPKLFKTARKKRKRVDAKDVDKRGKKETVEGAPKKRVIKRRMADNGFLPDFNFEEFQSKYNVRIDILSSEEQLREVEGRKAASCAQAPFACDVCGKGFASRAVYDGHMAKHSPSAGAHACEVCGLRFRTRSRAHVHQDAHRLRFRCAVCGFVTRTRFIAKNHFLSHAGATHKCPHCDAVFSKYTSCLTHVRRRHPAANAACDLCGETFVGRTGLRHHKTRAHRSAQVSVPALESACACGARFAGAAALRRHAAAAPAGCGGAMRPCALCGEACAGDEGLARHQRDQHAQGPLPCRECGLWFGGARALGTHRARVHLQQRAREPPRRRVRRACICEACGCECTVHLGQRPQVKCEVCGKLLAHAASLKLHVNTVHLRLPPPPRARRGKP